uniref:SRR1 domain-containing protein n=1 Tax=Macrostomum lignano TaxID=282301 RepID=A0A1I8FKS8_9PLAT
TRRTWALHCTPVASCSHLEYLQYYGWPALFASLEGVQLPHWPACICGVVSYREMWRLFDRAACSLSSATTRVHPAGGSRLGLGRQLLATAASFGFICVYHGNYDSVQVWILLNLGLSPMAQPGVSPPSGGGFRGGKSHSAFDGDFLFILRHPNWVAGDEGDAVAAADGTRGGLAALASRPPRSGKAGISRKLRVFQHVHQVDDDLALSGRRGLQQGMRSESIGLERAGRGFECIAAACDERFGAQPAQLTSRLGPSNSPAELSYTASRYLALGVMTDRPTQRTLKVLGHSESGGITDGLSDVKQCCQSAAALGRGIEGAVRMTRQRCTPPRRRCEKTSMCMQAEEAKPPARAPKPDYEPQLSESMGCGSGLNTPTSLTVLNAEQTLELFFHLIRFGIGQVDLVNHRYDRQLGREGQEIVGDGLRLNTIVGVNQQHDAVRSGHRTVHFVAEIHVTRRVHQVEQVGGPSAGGLVEQGDRLCLDGDAAVALSIFSRSSTCWFWGPAWMAPGGR